MSELIDNRTRRIRVLKQVVCGLHEGEPVEAVRGRLAGLVRECDASDIASMEQQLMAEGVPAKQIMNMCDLHAQAVRDVLVDCAGPAVPPGHPVDAFKRENAALGEQVTALRAALAALGDGDENAAVPLPALQEARRQFGLLMDVDKHYRRKEHLLFPFLEKRGITGPSTVMWGKDDEVRALLGELGTVLDEDATTAGDWRVVAGTVAERALHAIEEMIFKEERILLPMALQQLSEDEWAQVAAQSPEIGWCLVDPAGTWRPQGQEATAPAAAMAGSFVAPTGSLTAAQLQAMFATLPVDVTFVDADDRVRFFSEGRSRVFHRAKAIIGRRVQHCHPPASVGTVDRILSDFRSGTQDVAEFWIEMRGRFVHIRYFALRDEAGAYLGTLEVTQDLTRERALSGEQRLLQYAP